MENLTKEQIELVIFNKELQLLSTSAGILAYKNPAGISKEDREMLSLLFKVFDSTYKKYVKV